MFCVEGPVYQIKLEWTLITLLTVITIYIYSYDYSDNLNNRYNWDRPHALFGYSAAPITLEQTKNEMEFFEFLHYSQPETGALSTPTLL